MVRMGNDRVFAKSGPLRYAAVTKEKLYGRVFENTAVKLLRNAERVSRFNLVLFSGSTPGVFKWR